jgi:hypothetical protein
MGYARAPGGGLFCKTAKTPSLQTLRQTYTKLTRTLQLYGYTVLYKLLCATLHETYTKLTPSLQLHLVT